jgi:hypothetical protein
MPLVMVMLAQAEAATVAEQCVSDLASIPPFLLANDAGAKDELAQWGQAHFDAAFSQARIEATKAPDAATCNSALNAYLKSWRKGHLNVRDMPRTDARPENKSKQSPASGAMRAAPTVTLLSEQTALLTVPSFANEYREPLIALLEESRNALASHTNWIIDVRGNGGGSDTSYYPLLPWLMPDEKEDIGAEWLATPANIEGQENVCAVVAPGDKECETFAADAVKRMRTVPSGMYVAQEEGPAIHYGRVEKVESRRPARVAVLTDNRCGSSCEEFLLTVRQSFNVKLLGQPSYGTLDYSNMRPHRLPSGQRMLWYAISRSSRLPDLPVDANGVQPDIYLPQPTSDESRKSELSRVHRWLEGGSLSPTGSTPPAGTG